MNFKFFHGGKPTFDKKDFDSKDYKGYAVFYTKKEKPVALMQHKTRNVWKIQYGFSTLIFDSYTKAMDYCKSHLYDENGNKIN